MKSLTGGGRPHWSPLPRHHSLVERVKQLHADVKNERSTEAGMERLTSLNVAKSFKTFTSMSKLG